MSVSKTETIIKEKNIREEYPYFYNNFFKELAHSISEFFEKDVKLRLVGITLSDNILFPGDEYFVNKIQINSNNNFLIKLSSGVVNYFLNIALGQADKPFNLNNLTDIEAMLIKELTVFIYKQLDKKINKDDITRKVIKESKEYTLTVFVREKDEHIGQILITLPEYLVPRNNKIEIKEHFTIDNFKTAYADMPLMVGKSRIALNEVKSMENGDVIVLEDSDINNMSVVWNGRTIPFNVTPNPSLIIRVDNNGGNEMEEDNNLKPKNMWDTILVDIVAEFDKVKLTLGELKQISEGLVIDVGSVYDSKINLKVENQVVATGELVILNDRYGVRVDSVAKLEDVKSQEPKPAAKPQPNTPPKQQAPKGKPVAPKGAKPKEGDENFDYSDFEIEDESI